MKWHFPNLKSRSVFSHQGQLRNDYCPWLEKISPAMNDWLLSRAVVWIDYPPTTHRPEPTLGLRSNSGGNAFSSEAEIPEAEHKPVK
jgi:hypothetical protein